VEASEYEDVQQYVLSLLKSSGDDVVVLAPVHKGDVGVKKLNALAQQALNPPTPAKDEIVLGTDEWGRTFRVGDKVMQLKNRYGAGSSGADVCNGDVGFIVAVSKRDRTVTVQFDDNAIVYAQNEFEELDHAWACSVHKGQGSQYGTVVLVCHKSHFFCTNRNLIYTGLTRAEKKCIVVGQKEAVSLAVRNNQVTKRNTRLLERLRS
jgi:exodeoxyribonuclease V alpha subunit